MRTSSSTIRRESCRWPPASMGATSRACTKPWSTAPPGASWKARCSFPPAAWQPDVDKPWEAAAQTVLSRLAEEIVSGELGPGAKISEPEISKRYGVSRAPLREAIRKLEERSLVTREARRSARVIVLSPE